MKTPLPSEENKAMAAMFKHMAENGGGPARPMQMEVGKADNGEPYVWFTVGLTKREQFAAMAMQGILSCWEAQQKICNNDPRYKKQPDGQYNFDDVVATNAVEFADALLERLKK